MEIKRVNVVSYAGCSKNNQDKAFIVHKGNGSNVKYATWVIDGGSKFLDKKDLILNGKWFVDRWDNYLSSHILDFDLTIHEVLLEGMSAIEDEYIKVMKNDHIPKIDQPAIEIAIIRWCGHFLEYYVLGGCQLWIKDYKSIKVIADTKLTKFNAIVEEKLKDNIALGQTLEQAKEELKDLLLKIRSKCNKKNGYWLLTFDKIAVYHGNSGTIKFDNDEAFLDLVLSTDGFNAICNRYKIMDEMNVVNYLKKYGMEELCKVLRRVENKDANCLSYTRLQKSDDASATYIRMEKSID